LGAGAVYALTVGADDLPLIVASAGSEGLQLTRGSEVTQVQTGVVCKVLLLIVLVPVLAVAQAPQTYSDVREVEESGDVVGTELTLQVAGEVVNGTLRHYEGTEPESIAVTGRLVRSSLTLSGSYSEGKVQITARVQNDRVIGKLSYQLNGQTNDVELNLRRVERPRMQKAATPATSCHPCAAAVR
jgi:hypothetical protein